jgi:hypothetical protein
MHLCSFLLLMDLCMCEVVCTRKRNVVLVLFDMLFGLVVNWLCGGWGKIDTVALGLARVSMESLGCVG